MRVCKGIQQYKDEKSQQILSRQSTRSLPQTARLEQDRSDPKNLRVVQQNTSNQALNAVGNSLVQKISPLFDGAFNSNAAGLTAIGGSFNKPSRRKTSRGKSSDNRQSQVCTNVFPIRTFDDQTTKLADQFYGGQLLKNPHFKYKRSLAQNYLRDPKNDMAPINYEARPCAEVLANTILNPQGDDGKQFWAEVAALYRYQYIRGSKPNTLDDINHQGYQYRMGEHFPYQFKQPEEVPLYLAQKIGNSAVKKRNTTNAKFVGSLGQSTKQLSSGIGTPSLLKRNQTLVAEKAKHDFASLVNTTQQLNQQDLKDDPIGDNSMSLDNSLIKKGRSNIDVHKSSQDEIKDREGQSTRFKSGLKKMSLDYPTRETTVPSKITIAAGQTNLKDMPNQFPGDRPGKAKSSMHTRKKKKEAEQEEKQIRGNTKSPQLRSKSASLKRLPEKKKKLTSRMFNFGGTSNVGDLLNEASQKMPELDPVVYDKEQLLQNSKKRPKTTKNARSIKKAFKKLPPTQFINPVPNDKTLVLDIDEELLMSHHGFHLKLFMDKQVKGKYHHKKRVVVNTQNFGFKEQDSPYLQKNWSRSPMKQTHKSTQALSSVNDNYNQRTMEASSPESPNKSQTTYKQYYKSSRYSMPKNQLVSKNFNFSNNTSMGDQMNNMDSTPKRTMENIDNIYMQQPYTMRPQLQNTQEILLPVNGVQRNHRGLGTTVNTLQGTATKIYDGKNYQPTTPSNPATAINFFHPSQAKGFHPPINRICPLNMAPSMESLYYNTTNKGRQTESITQYGSDATPHSGNVTATTPSKTKTQLKFKSVKQKTRREKQIFQKTYLGQGGDPTLQTIQYKNQADGLNNLRDSQRKLKTQL